jgi:hypothetical protein
MGFFDNLFGYEPPPRVGGSFGLSGGLSPSRNPFSTESRRRVDFDLTPSRAGNRLPQPGGNDTFTLGDTQEFREAAEKNFEANLEARKTNKEKRAAILSAAIPNLVRILIADTPQDIDRAIVDVQASMESQKRFRDEVKAQKEDREAREQFQREQQAQARAYDETVRADADTRQRERDSYQAQHDKEMAEARREHEKTMRSQDRTAATGAKLEQRAYNESKATQELIRTEQQSLRNKGVIDEELYAEIAQGYRTGTVLPPETSAKIASRLMIADLEHRALAQAKTPEERASARWRAMENSYELFARSWTDPSQPVPNIDQWAHQMGILEATQEARAEVYNYDEASRQRKQQALIRDEEMGTLIQAAKTNPANPKAATERTLIRTVLPAEAIVEKIYRQGTMEGNTPSSVMERYAEVLGRGSEKEQAVRSLFMDKYGTDLLTATREREAGVPGFGQGTGVVDPNLDLLPDSPFARLRQTIGTGTLSGMAGGL